jgi:hypothetical protein
VTPGTSVANLTAFLDASVNPPLAELGKTRRYGSSRLTLPRSLLDAPVTYRVVLSLTNFLGFTTDSSPAITTRVALSVPVVAIQGAASRTVLRTQAFSLFCAASISPCSKARTLAYTWRIAGPNAASLTRELLGPTNTDPRFFRVPANRLAPNGVYNISVTVRDSLGMAANASVQVLVGRSPLTAVIDGGDRTVGQAVPFSLVGSSSRDPDGTAPLLAYTWGCTRGGAAYGKACGFPLGNNATVGVPGGQALGATFSR